MLIVHCKLYEIPTNLILCLYGNRIPKAYNQPLKMLLPKVTLHNLNWVGFPDLRNEGESLNMNVTLQLLTLLPRYQRVATFKESTFEGLCLNKPYEKKKCQISLLGYTRVFATEEKVEKMSRKKLCKKLTYMSFLAWHLTILVLWS